MWEQRNTMAYMFFEIRNTPAEDNCAQVYVFLSFFYGFRVFLLHFLFLILSFSVFIQLLLFLLLNILLINLHTTSFKFQPNIYCYSYPLCVVVPSDLFDVTVYDSLIPNWCNGRFPVSWLSKLKRQGQSRYFLELSLFAAFCFRSGVGQLQMAVHCFVHLLVIRILMLKNCGKSVFF